MKKWIDSILVALAALTAAYLMVTMVIPVFADPQLGTRLQDLIEYNAADIVDEDVMYLVDVTGTPGTPTKVTIAELKVEMGATPADIWVNETGDTMTGTLTLNSGGQVIISAQSGGSTRCAEFTTTGQIQAGSDACNAVGATDIWVNESGDTMTGALNFSGVATDITSDTNENITLDPAGTGVVNIPDEAFVVGGAAAGASELATFDSDVKAIRVSNVADVETDIVTPVNGMIAYDGLEDLLKGYVNGTWVDLGQSAGGGGDITDVFNCPSGDCNTVTVQDNEYLYIETGAEVQATTIYSPVTNNTGATLYKCTAVYVSGFDIPSDFNEVSIADADVAGSMPTVGLVVADIADGASGFVILAGVLEGADTTVPEGWAVGDSLYVNTSGTSASADCGNTLTNTKPSGSATQLQKMGQVIRVNPSNGQIIISGAGRTNDTPNLGDAEIFLGDASGVTQQVNPSGDVDIDNTGTFTIQADSIEESMLDVIDGDTPADGECLSYDTGGANGDFEWIACGAGGSGIGNDLNGIDFLTLTNNGTLDSERAFTTGLLVEATDAGAGSTYTVTLTGTFTGGKWCRLTDDGLAFNCAENEPAGGSGEWTRTTTGQDRLYPTTAPTVDWVVVGASADPASTDPDWTDTKLFVEGTMGATGGLRLGDSNPGVGDDQDIAMWGQVDNLIVNAGISTAGVGTSKLCFNATTGSDSTCLSEEVGGPVSSDEIVMPNVSGTMAVYTGDTTTNPCSGEADGTLLNDSTSNEICICIGGNAKQLSASTTNCF